MADPAPAADRTLRVGQLHAQVTAALRRAFPTEVWVAGEVVGKKTAPSGHTYLDLVERPAPGAPPAAVAKVVCYRQHLPAVRDALTGTGVRVTDGVEVRIRAQVTVYRGQLQLSMTGIDPTYTLGRIVADRDAVLRTLAAEGLLEANRSLPMPAAPLRLGLVTSMDSAAFHDFRDELDRSRYSFQVLAVDTRVQGPDAPDSIRAALAKLSALAVDTAAPWRPDLLVVIRGGGSRTDLATFDTEPVARAITACPVPVLTGIGHETDRAVADEVSHTSLKTPTAVAGHLVTAIAARMRRDEETFTALITKATASLAASRTDVDRASTALAHAATAHLQRSTERLQAATHRVGTAAGATLHRQATRLDTATDRLIREAPRAVARHTAAIDAAASTVRAHDPARVLARGYSITRTADGRAVTDPAGLPPGSALLTQLARGSLTSTVTTTTTTAAADNPTETAR